MTFESWVNFTFGLAGPRNLFTPDEVPGMQFPFPAAELLEHCSRFFVEAKKIIRNVPRQNVVQAFKVFPSIDGYLGILALPSLPLSSRKHLAELHFPFLRDVFFSEDFDGTGFMWYERLVGAQYDGGPSVQSDAQICEALLSAAEKLIAIASEPCQLIALHSINEICPCLQIEPGVIVQRLLLSSTLSSPKVRAYALDVSTGNAP